MAFYAVDEDDLIYAGEAEAKKTYWCLDCFGPVKRRKGKSWVPHFYHLKTSPQCRLYSKTEDHLLAQIQLQKSFPEGVIQLERPFVKINRVADACWEKEKIVFEIQCSPITEKEVEMRENDYKSIGYCVVWLLDDKRYNRRVIRPAENALRKACAYYVCIRQGLSSVYYDQFEIFLDGRRVKRGKRMMVDLQKIASTPQHPFNPEVFPKQIVALTSLKYFHGDRLSLALRNRLSIMQYWRGLELQLTQKTHKQKKWILWIEQNLFRPYLALIQKVTNEIFEG